MMEPTYLIPWMADDEAAASPSPPAVPVPLAAGFLFRSMSLDSFRSSGLMSVAMRAHSGGLNRSA